MKILKKVVEYLIYFYILILPWQTIFIFQESYFGDYKNQFATIGMYASEIILWIIFMLWLILFLQKIKEKKRIDFSWSPDRKFILACLIFIIYIFSSIFWSFDKEIVLNKNLHILEAILFFIILIIGVVDYKRFLKILILSSVLPCVLGISEFLTQSFLSNKFLGLSFYDASISGPSIIVGEGIGRWIRNYGSFPHPNFFAGFLVISFVASLILFKTAKNKMFLFFVTCLQVMSLFFTFSRSAWVSFVLIIIFFIWFFIKEDKKYFKSNGKYFVALFFLLLSLVFIFKPLLITRMSNQAPSEQRSISERTDLNKESFEIIKNNLFFGVGSGNYISAVYDLNPNKPAWEYQPVHNVFLLFLAEFGVFGLIFFLGIIFTFKTFYFSESKPKFASFFLFFCLILPIFSLDHYFYSFYAGLIYLSIFVFICFGLSSGNPLFFPKNIKNS